MAKARSRGAGTTVVLGDGRIMLIGGLVGTSESVIRTEILDPAAMRWSAGPDLATARASMTATILPDGKIIVTGGIKLASTEVLATGIPAPHQRAARHPLPDGPLVLAPVPDCSDMPPAEIAIHLESWLTVANMVKADPEQAKATGRAKFQAT